MSIAYRIMGCLPVPGAVRLRWQGRLLDRAYHRDGLAANLRKDHELVASLRRTYDWEKVMHQREENVLYSQQLLPEARRLRVPVPPREEGSAFCNEAYYVGS